MDVFKNRTAVTYCTFYSLFKCRQVSFCDIDMYVHNSCNILSIFLVFRVRHYVIRKSYGRISSDWLSIADIPNGT